MPEASDSELRWLLGKIVYCALNATSTEQFVTWMSDVSYPEAILEVLPEMLPPEAVDNPLQIAGQVAFIAACWLHGHGSAEESRAHAQINAAFHRLADLPEALVDPETAATEDSGASEQAQTAASAVAEDAGSTPQSGTQVVDVGRDVNAPIINAPGGSVYVNDRSWELDKVLHDYLTFLLYVSFGVKQPDVTDDVRPTLEDAMNSLVRYHGTTRAGTLGDNPELHREAPAVRDKVDAACQAIFGLTFQESRPALFRSEFPSFPLFEHMTLITGGHDVFTHTDVAPFYLARHPVTVAQYAEFCRATGWPPVPEWNAMAPPAAFANHPVTGVTLFDTVMFCVWLESATGFRFRVATESEWCFAATRGRQRAYPWGDEYRRGYATTQLEHPQGTMPVDAHPEGATEDGILDLAGNVWELTSTLFDEQAWASGMNFTFPPMLSALARAQWWETDRRIPQGAGPWLEAARFVMRGGSYGGGPEWATMDQRIWTSIFNRGAYGGFRIACSAERVGDGFVPTPSYLAPRLGSFADRIELANADGSSAVVQHQFTSCGGGGTWEGELRDQLLEWAVGQYSSLDGVPLKDDIRLDSRAQRIATSRGFPLLSPRPAHVTAAQSVDPASYWARFDAELRYSLSKETTRAIDIAKDVASNSGSSQIRSDHLMIGLVEADDQLVGPAVMTLGVLAAELRRFASSAATDETAPVETVGFTEGVARALGLDKPSSYTPPVDVMTRLVGDPDRDLAPVLASRSIDAGSLRTAVAGIHLGRRLLRSRDAPPAREEMEAALEIHRKLYAQRPEAAIPGLAAITIALANAMTVAGVPDDEVRPLEWEALKFRKALSGATDPALSPLHSGLSQRLVHRGLLLMDRRRFGEAIETIDAAIALDRGRSDEHERGPLAWALGRKAVALMALGRFDEALPLVHEAATIYTDLSRRERGDTRVDYPQRLALALNDEADCLGRLERHDEAYSLIVVAMRVALPLFQRAERPMPLHLREPAVLRDTYDERCAAVGMEPDGRIVERLDLALNTTSAGPPPDLPALDSCRYELEPVAPDAHLPCRFCDAPESAVAGIRGAICLDCIDLAGRVFRERELEGEAAKPVFGTYDKHGSRCALCGWIVPPREAVHGGAGEICRDCQSRSVALTAPTG